MHTLSRVFAFGRSPARSVGIGHPCLLVGSLFMTVVVVFYYNLMRASAATFYPYLWSLWVVGFVTLHLIYVRALRLHLGLALRGGASNLMVMVKMSFAFRSFFSVHLEGEWWCRGRGLKNLNGEFCALSNSSWKNP